MALLSRFSDYRSRRRRPVRQFAFESLEDRNMPAVLVDVGHHMVEPNMSGQTVKLSVVSTDATDAAVAGFDLRAQIVTTKQGPYFERVRFAGDLWNSFPHVESGSPFPTDRTLATGAVAFTQGFEAQADGTLVTFTIDTTGIPAGSYQFRLMGTRLGSSSFRGADGSSISETITNGTLQVRSIWQNPDNPYDINRDGRVSPVDVLLLLNELSKKGSYELPLPSPGEEPSFLFDVDGDGHLSPKDPLGAINCLNGLGCSTTPKPILAQVSPSFSPPQLPDSTSVGESKSQAEDLPPAEAIPDHPPVCDYYELDDNQLPIPVSCDNSDEVISSPLPVDTSVSEQVTPQGDSVTSEPTSTSDTSALPTTTGTRALSPHGVDAIFFDRVNELFDQPASEELVDLGLGALST